MSKEFSITDEINSRMNLIKSKIFKNERRRLIFIELYASSKWKRDPVNCCWIIEVSDCDVKAIITDQEINTNPELSAGFIYLHDSTISNFDWASSDPFWKEDLFLDSLKGIEERKMEKIVDELFNKYPWIGELDDK